MSDRWQRFGLQHRITKAQDFARVLRNRKRFSDRLITAAVLCTGDQVARLGVVVSRKVSKKAVERNRIKRLIRESFRLRQQQLRGCAVVVIAGPNCRHADNRQIFSSLTRLWSVLETECADS